MHVIDSVGVVDFVGGLGALGVLRRSFAATSQGFRDALLDGAQCFAQRRRTLCAI